MATEVEMRIEVKAGTTTWGGGERGKVTKFELRIKAKAGTKMGGGVESGMATEVGMRIEAKSGTRMGDGNECGKENKLGMSTEAKGGTGMGPNEIRMEAEVAKVMMAEVKARIGTTDKMKVKMKAKTGTEIENTIGWRTEAETWTDTREADRGLLEAGSRTEIEGIKSGMKPGLGAEMGIENGIGKGMEGEAGTERKAAIRLRMKNEILVACVKISTDLEGRMRRIIDIGGRI
ncbi:hypothetical protein CYMTET_49503 [Cymbomonas tetramitiformis]|uniref:Uncharacterized protein n=1 Tax=Cymbomonas tetramitiformis TaxID=36881 RepID=A0AAE0ETU2_9CHLO|nr:hypothetical protein CYMTET_49503 [Cymbomonas tetramitiformis]|eukprot:gene10528-12458_t